MSASIIPTFFPKRAKATARLTETVDFPTPPFPLATAKNVVFELGDNKDSLCSSSCSGAN